MTQVTVLMSVYNDAAFVGEAVHSILEQTFADFELLVIDDGSTDGSADIIARYRDPRVRILRNKSNLGLARSLNIGLAAARTNLIARQDGDDVSLPQRLERQVEAFARRPELVVLGTQAHAVNERRRPVRGAAWRKCITPLGIEWQLMFESPFVHSSVMFRRDVIWEQLGGYDDRFRTTQMSEDFDLWSRVIPRHPTANLEQPLLILRCRPRSVSKSYSVELIQRAGDQLVQNRSRSLQQSLGWDEGLLFWVSLNNPAICAPLYDVAPFVVSVKEILSRFEQVHAGAVTTPEIRQHVALIFTRVADLLAPHAAAALRALAAAHEFDRGAAWKSVLSVVARTLVRTMTSRGRATGRERLELPEASGNHPS
jgi:glycosyltransferase involved in cell wall biosynthesis